MGLSADDEIHALRCDRAAILAELEEVKAERDALKKALHDLIENYMDTAGGSPVAHAEFMRTIRRGRKLLDRQAEDSSS